MNGESQFPGCYTIDDMGLDALCYFLKKEFEGKNIIISVKEENAEQSAANGITR